jgi:stage II sporulation protein GA (sporulation sigma-E factor processing peptidase)
METVLYADVLFLINFSMDYLALFAAARLLSLPAKTGGMLMGAVLGGVYGVLATVYSWQGIFGALAAFAVSCAMVRVAGGRPDSFGGFLRAVFSVWGIGALIGGIMTLIGGSFHGTAAYASYMDYPAVIAAVVVFVRMLLRRGGRGFAEISFSYGENTYAGRALVDSGNLLTDPISGLPVVLIRASDARTFAGGEVDGKFAGAFGDSMGLSPGIRAVPVHGVDGCRILYGFLCPEMRVQKGKRSLRRSAVICVDRSTKDFGGCGVLLPASLL